MGFIMNDVVDLEEINSRIEFYDGKIERNALLGYTSKLWKMLHVKGWKIRERNGVYEVFNHSGTRVLNGTSKVDVLEKIAAMYAATIETE